MPILQAKELRHREGVGLTSTVDNSQVWPKLWSAGGSCVIMELQTSAFKVTSQAVQPDLNSHRHSHRQNKRRQIVMI